VRWQDDRVTIVPYTESHVRLVRYRPNMLEPRWSVTLDVTSGHRDLRVGAGNRVVVVADTHLLVITCGEYWTGESAHNFRLHAFSADGELLWSCPWRTIQRFTCVDEALLVVCYSAPPEIWIEDAPLVAQLLDPRTGELLATYPVCIPADLLPHYQSGAVTDLRGYLIWHDGRLVLTVRPSFHPDYKPAWQLHRRGSFKQLIVPGV
jgi:hypothetical protein